jgi:hypothetical protein
MLHLAPTPLLPQQKSLGPTALFQIYSLPGPQVAAGIGKLPTGVQCLAGTAKMAPMISEMLITMKTARIRPATLAPVDAVWSPEYQWSDNNNALLAGDHVPYISFNMYACDKVFN